VEEMEGKGNNLGESLNDNYTHTPLHHIIHTTPYGGPCAESPTKLGDSFKTLRYLASHFSILDDVFGSMGGMEK